MVAVAGFLHMKKLLLLVFTFLALVNSPICDAKILKLKKDKTDSAETISLSEWARQQAEKLPEQVDGVRIMRPMFEEEGKVEISDMIDVPGVKKDQVFIAAVVYVADNLDTETDGIETIDYDKRRFVVLRKITKGEGKNAVSYIYRTAYQAADNLLSFASYDVDAEFKEKGLIPRKMRMDKMKPNTNIRHAEMIEDFSVENSLLQNQVASYVKKHPSLMVTHWADVKAGRVVNGMNESEVKLIYGAPETVREIGDRVKWAYANQVVVVFKNGKVIIVSQ